MVDERASGRRVAISRHVRNCRADGPLAVAWKAYLAYLPAGPGGLPARGLASLTVRVRPASSVTWSPAMAVVVNARFPTYIFTKGSLWNMVQQLPGHPNSMQEQNMQEHHVGGNSEKSLEVTKRVL